jgi:hypothetical protein
VLLLLLLVVLVLLLLLLVVLVLLLLLVVVVVLTGVESTPEGSSQAVSLVAVFLQMPCQHMGWRSAISTSA